MIDRDKAIQLLKEVGLYELCGSDGCLCGSCEIQGVHITVSCWKSSAELPDGSRGILVRVYSRGMDVNPADLFKVAFEVGKQVHALAPHTNLHVRFCDYQHDREWKCVYCSNKRDVKWDYLCKACADGKRDSYGDLIAPQYQYEPLVFEGRDYDAPA